MQVILILLQLDGQELGYGTFFVINGKYYYPFCYKWKILLCEIWSFILPSNNYFVKVLIINEVQVFVLLIPIIFSLLPKIPVTSTVLDSDCVIIHVRQSRMVCKKLERKEYCERRGKLSPVLCKFLMNMMNSSNKPDISERKVKRNDEKTTKSQHRKTHIPECRINSSSRHSKFLPH